MSWYHGDPQVDFRAHWTGYYRIRNWFRWSSTGRSHPHDSAYCYIRPAV
ncbi:MAG: hypothetical protein M3321_08415 [Actinomycetota bacterium]|nr:hypothetical protein [Actinomycetota bacterium]